MKETSINDEVWLSFKTTRLRSEILKNIAKEENKTQPEIIEEIITSHIKLLDEIAKEKLKEEGYIK